MMKKILSITTIALLVIISIPVQAIELVDKKGSFDAKIFDGKIYNDRGQYTGMITPEGKMYDKDGQFTGQIKGQSIIDKDGDTKGFIREGKIYGKDGHYKGRLKH